MMFVAPSRYPTSYLRGQQVAKVLGARLVEKMDSTRDDVVVCVKFAEPADIAKAKKQGNLVCWDVLDFMCYSDRNVTFGKDVDVLIVPNKACEDVYRETFPNARCVVIPHHWDERITGKCPTDKPRPAYLGAPFNLAEHVRQRDMFFTCVLEFGEMVRRAHEFNIHLCVTKRREISRVVKPATKVSVAAAVGAVAVCFPDPSQVELLGTDYPFYIDKSPVDTMRLAAREFGSPVWTKAQEILAEVKKKTAITEIAKMYENIKEKAFA